jgi:Zn-dependent M28 family amino/carboxypeptidase
MATEPYNRLVRLVERGEEVEIELNIEATFHRDDPTAYNVIAELPGSDLADQQVMAGAHLDSWHAGGGATDNGGSCAVVMEAIRLLRASGLEPRRTVQVALWFGEEQGFRGSRAYITRHLATRPETEDPEQLTLPKMLRKPTWPINTLPGHAKLSAYLNVDYGAGRVRGIYAQENVAAMPIFEAWIEPLRDLGVTTVSPQIAGGTDHLAFDRVGIPAFQLIQDPMDYMTRTHHTNIDTFDHLNRNDLVQSSVVLATFLWHAANRDEPLPRKPMPRAPEEPEHDPGKGEE